MLKTIQISLVVKEDDAHDAVRLLHDSLHMDAYIIQTTVSDSTEAETNSYVELFGDEYFVD